VGGPYEYVETPGKTAGVESGRLEAAMGMGIVRSAWSAQRQW